MIVNIYKRFYCIGLVLGCMVYCIAVIGVIYAPTVWLVHRVINR